MPCIWNIRSTASTKFVLILSFLMQAGSLLADDQTPIGIVKTVQGQWACSRDGKEITSGMMILPNDRIVTDGTSTGSVSILLFSSGNVWTQSCSSAKPCEGSYRPLVPSHSEPSGFWSFLSGYLHSETKLAPVFAGSRSIEPGPSHTLLTPVDDRVNLKQALADVSPGQYIGEIVLRSVADDRSSNPKQIQINWDGKSDVPVSGLTPGLYSFTLSRPTGEQVGSTAAILIVSAGQTQPRETWAEVKKRTASWKQADTGTVESILLATLIALDSQQSGGR